MPAQSFAAYSKHRPVLANGALHGYTCHMAALHWAFRELGDNEATAGAKVELIATAKCPQCQGLWGGLVTHPSFPSSWYGPALCGGGVLVPDRAAMRANVVVGDVVLAGVPQFPMHSMVTVGKTSLLGWHWTNIRGLNNVGTLGTGPHLQYDSSDRNIDQDKYWHAVNAATYFGQSAMNQNRCYRVPIANFIADAQLVSNGCNLLAGTYTGP